MRPRVVVRWRMTANGIGMPLHPIDGVPVLTMEGPPRELRAALERYTEQGVTEVAIDGDPELIATAFEQRLVDAVVCFIDPSVALASGPAVTGGAGAAAVDEGWRLTDVRYTLHDGLIRVDAQVSSGVIARRGIGAT